MMTAHNKTIWTAGNVLMLVGAYLLLYVGGLYADERYNIWAADGSSTIPLPVLPSTAAQPPAVQPKATSIPPVASVRPPSVVQPSVPNARNDPDTQPRPHIQLNNPGDGREISSVIPQVGSNWGDNTITRVVIPGIKLDKKVQQVGWHIEQQNGVQVAIWDVAKYAVGHNQGTANPGDPGNIVLTGHSGGSEYPFNDLYWVPMGSKVILWAHDKPFSYTVTERLIVDELGPGVTDAQRRENARYIEETPNEQITMVTCWPLTGKLKFTQRVLVHAIPDQRSSAPPAQSSLSSP